MTDLTTHKLSFAGYTFYLAFRKGDLFLIQFPEKKLTPRMQSKFLEGLPNEEKELKNYGCFFSNHTKFDVTHKQLAEAKTQQDKIVLFGMAFKHYRGVAYQAKDTEKSNIKHVPVNAKLLETFFTSPGMKNFTVENYVHRINITKDYAVNGFPDQRFPDQWDREFWRQCDDTTRMAYEKALVAKGYTRRPTVEGTMFVKEQ